MKTNPFLKPPPVRVLKPRIIIDMDLSNGKSNLRTEGPVTVPLVIDCLMAQLQSLWTQFIKTMTRPVVGANGEPTYKDAPPAEKYCDFNGCKESVDPTVTYCKIHDVVTQQ